MRTMQGKDLHARKERAVASLKNSHKEKGENQIHPNQSICPWQKVNITCTDKLLWKSPRRTQVLPVNLV